MANTGDINVGSVIRYNGELVVITDYQHRTPGNLRAFYQAKMRNLKTGKQTENRFRSGEEVTLVRVEYRMMQFIYPEGEFVVVMDPETFEQIHLPAVMSGDGIEFLIEGMDVRVTFEGDEPILPEAPTLVELTVAYAEPGVAGNSSANTFKPCKMETGAEIMVPLFIEEGEVIKIDTRARAYVERVKK